VIRLVLLMLILSMTGCVSVSVDDLPDDSSEIDFSETIDDRTGWRTAEKSHLFVDTNREIVFLAAKAALLHEQYDVVTSSLEDGVVIGKHPMTLTRYELVSGIYFNQLEADTQVRIIVKGQFDITYPAPAWWTEDAANEIFKDMRLYLNTEAGSNSPDR
jgi:hypothetical protein